MSELAPYAELPGAGAAGGLGAALAALGAALVPGAREVLRRLRFRELVREADHVVTGEGTVDGTTTTGKAPGEALRVCLDEAVRCVVFGGRVEVELAGACRRRSRRARRAPIWLLGGLGRTESVPLGRAARPEAASLVARIASCY